MKSKARVSKQYVDEVSVCANEEEFLKEEEYTDSLCKISSLEDKVKRLENTIEELQSDKARLNRVIEDDELKIEKQKKEIEKLENALESVSESSLAYIASIAKVTGLVQ